MKYMFALFITTSLFFDVKSQNLNKEIGILNTFIRDYLKVESKVFYNLGVDSTIKQTTLESVLSGILKDKIKPRTKKTIIDNILLNPDEISEVSQKIKYVENFPLKRNSLENSKLVKKNNTISSKPFTYYTFSRPIFFRNDTMCIIMYNYACGVRCGEGFSLVFMKIDGEWTRLFILESYVS